jgi:carbon-monoxide dehydrogenase medium subunit
VKITTRAAHDWPALGLTLSVLFERRTLKDIRLILSAAVDRPIRLSAAEEELRGAELSDAVLSRAGDAAAGEAEMDSDTRGSADYKQHLLRVHLKRAMQALAAEEGR